MNTEPLDRLRTKVADTATDLYARRGDAADSVKSAAGVVGSRVSALPAQAYAALPSVKRRRRRNQQLAIVAGVVVGLLVGREVYKRWKLRRHTSDDAPRGTRTPSLSTIQFRRSG